ncbi:hypothetical protein RhiLY_04717 [Ceratobasidium sp. AG-Ba]|nr:hypothetical protein RhiLY_04717 [Ceratobasidium sp. AG-Ba]
MLLLATQLAHETKQRTLLLAVLGAMLRTLRQGHQGLELEAETEGITIVRCSVRIILDLLQEPLAATNELVNSLMEYFRRALDLIGTVSAKGNLAIIAKDASWLWRTAYNAAVSGCRDWDELVVVELFDLARELMDAYSNTLRAEQDLDLRDVLFCSVFGASGRLFVARRLGSSQDATVLYERLADDLPNFRRSALRALPDGVFDGDQPGLCGRRRRAQLMTYVALFQIDPQGSSTNFTTPKFMLRSSLDSKHMSIDKFSRCFIEQAVEVIKENVDESGDKRWIEAAIALARLVNNSGAASEKVGAKGYSEPSETTES